MTKSVLRTGGGDALDERAASQKEVKTKWVLQWRLFKVG
jgi:hypothetical protein